MGLPVRERRFVRPRTVMRWDPLRELEDLQQRTVELLENTWTGEPGAGEDARVWVPLVDIEETEDAWILEAEMPGVKPENIDVEVRDNEVEITGDILEREHKGILRRRNRRSGRFEFRATLPGAVDASGIDARAEHGVLTVRVPKAEEARSRRVQVQSGSQSGS
jgi:HSP20 family protein